MTYQFQTSDLVCSRMIEIELDDRGERVKRVQFVGGCPGNLAGIGRRDDAGRAHRPAAGHPLRRQADLVSGPAGDGAPGDRGEEERLMRLAGRLYRARCGNGEGRLFSVPGFFGGKLDNGPKCVYVNCKLSV